MDGPNDQNGGYSSDYSIEEIDLTENPLYQVLSTLLEDAEGSNLCECLNKVYVIFVDNFLM